MEHMMEQRMNVKFCVKLKKSSNGQMPVHVVDIKEFPLTKEAMDAKVQDENMLICYFDIGFRYVPEETTVILHGDFEKLSDTMRHKQGELLRDSSLILHHNNALAHPSLRVSQFLAGKDISAEGSKLYSPDLAPTNFCLFPELRSVLKEKRFSDIKDIKSCVMKILSDIPVQDFKNCFEQWPKH
jgi:transposase